MTVSCDEFGDEQHEQYAADMRRPAPTSTLDYNSFLKLLTAQMKFQDPTKPTDATQFVSQLASFSSVEQGIKHEYQARFLHHVSGAQPGGWLAR